MSPSTIGVEANAPNELVPVIAKRHLTFSFATLRESIGVLVVARVLARSRLWAGQPPGVRRPLRRRPARRGVGRGAAGGERAGCERGAGEREGASRLRTRSPLAEPRRAPPSRAHR